MRRWAGSAVLLACAVGCASTDAAAPAAAPVPGISAEAVLLRTDAAAGGRFQVRITAASPFTVTAVALDSPGFAPEPPTTVSADFEPGRVTDLRTPLGEARCDVAPEPASARLTVVRPGSGPEEVDVPLGAAVLARVHADECAEQALAERVAVEVRGLRDDGDALTGSLTLVRRSGGDEVRLTRLMRSVLVAVEVELPLVLAPDAAEAEVPVRFAPATCEPHVLAEAKQPFLFPLAVQVGEAETTAELPVAAQQRAQLQELVQRVCG